jgi:hypothetical protein
MYLGKYRIMGISLQCNCYYIIILGLYNLPGQQFHAAGETGGSARGMEKISPRGELWVKMNV